MNTTPAQKRYKKRMWAAMAAYVVLVVAATYVLRRDLVAGPAAWLLALTPAAAILGVIAAMGLYLKEEDDEFQRAVVVEGLLWGIGATLALTTVWGFLEVYVEAPKLPSFWSFPIFCGVFGIAQPLVRRRFG